MSDRDEPPSVSEHRGDGAASASAAVESLERLGLSSYEAKVFVALQRLGDGTAQDVSEVADVPRSQVYGTADELARRGLVEQVESSPKRYRPVSLAAARSQLTARLEREQERAFENLRALEDTADEGSGDTAVATVRGSHPVRERVAALVADGDERIVYVAPSAAQVSDAVGTALVDRGAAGVSVILVAGEASLVDRFADDPVFVVDMSDDDMTGFTGRTLLVDEATVLLSVVPGPDDPESDEVALWTDGTSVGRILGRFVRTGMEAGMERAAMAEETEVPEDAAGDLPDDAGGGPER